MKKILLLKLLIIAFCGCKKDSNQNSVYRFQVTTSNTYSFRVFEAISKGGAEKVYFDESGLSSKSFTVNAPSKNIGFSFSSSANKNWKIVIYRDDKLVLEKDYTNVASSGGTID